MIENKEVVNHAERKDIKTINIETARLQNLAVFLLNLSTFNY